MNTPYLSVESDAEPIVLFGSGARFVAAADGIVTVRPVVNDNAVTVRLPGRADVLTLNSGDRLSITVAAGDVIEIV
ncbi:MULTISPECIES: hypothetical protein [unclassified Mesorhizobium]|uniref:hypothetical protein n=1 Tax=unclassified Mesorhizobium TaxID=325217 RepID=UPI001CCE554A|nr:MULTISPECIES: hypothetical protein [unclassified Mesorhizobium]MBZ9741016.1 hypothetical protein [Mesorhizobium sp. CO1-1-4]MBZ9804375.1 hypothetical protein [Mesorhizobium sp. ES1-6]